MKVVDLFEEDEGAGIYEGREPLPKDVIDAFKELGSAQRGDPEAAMLKVQHTMGGGVLNPVVEHTGDLTHRMSHMAGWAHSYAGQEYVINKCKTVLRYLTYPYGFVREMNENVRNNAKYEKISVKEYREKINSTLQKYAESHKKLTVYNKMQYYAREAAVVVGQQNWNTAIEYLELLLSYAEKSKEEWVSKAYSYQRDTQGKIIPYHK